MISVPIQTPFARALLTFMSIDPNASADPLVLSHPQVAPVPGTWCGTERPLLLITALFGPASSGQPNQKTTQENV
ncbi:hypothetical protein [Nocardia sp. NPDC049707]|uniref:hypothetical protein n=1 Tax=Nocardia sp. NPDC049707 TaxID=3154735 RepID=UPI003435AA4E